MKPPVTHQYENALVTIHFAQLSQEERRRRMEMEIKPALAQFGRAALAAGMELEIDREKEGPTTSENKSG